MPYNNLDIRTYFKTPAGKYPYGNNNINVITTNDTVEWNGNTIRGKNINGVVFTDISTWNGNPTAQQATQYCNHTPESLKNLLANSTIQQTEHPLDEINKGMGILFVNWNGVIIKNGNFTTGADKVICDSAEFLSIFNNVTENVYNKIVKENTEHTDKILRSNIKVSQIGVPTNNGQHLNLFDIPLNSDLTDYQIENKEIWDILYYNTSNQDIEIILQDGYRPKINTGNSSITTDYVFKVPNGTTPGSNTPGELSITIAPGGYAEINYMRVDYTYNNSTVKAIWIKGS